MPKLKPSTSAECVKVVVRCRPLDEKEIRDGHERIVDIDVNKGCITIHNPKGSNTEPPRIVMEDV